ncbi:MAG: hypothetical protein AAGE01_14750 [Pseudomonadota bacterium]
MISRGLPVFVAVLLLAAPPTSQAQACAQLAANGASFARGVTEDGTLALVQSTATDLIRAGNAPGLLTVDTRTWRFRSIVAADDIASAAMSSDGTTVAWIDTDATLRVRLASGSVRVLAEDASAPLVISPNGARIAFVADAGGGSRLQVVRSSNGAVLLDRVLEDIELGGFDRVGRQLVFATSRSLASADGDGFVDVYVVDLTTGLNRLVSLDTDDADAGTPSIDKAGERVAYVRGPVRAVGNRQVVLATIGGEDLLTGSGLTPTIDPTGEFLVHQTRVGTASGTIQALVRGTFGDAGEPVFAFPAGIQHLEGPLFADSGATVVIHTGVANLDRNVDCNDLPDVYVARDEESNDLLTLSRMRQVRIANPAAFGNGRFGDALGVAGARVFVGAPGDDAAGADAGRVFIFQREGQDFVLEDSLAAPPGFFTAALGRSIAVAGDTLLVGAPDTPATAKGGLQPLQAAIWQRLATGWRFKQPLVQPAPMANEFGAAVALGGQQMAVGAPSDGEAGTGAGAVFVFDPDGDGVLRFREKLLPGPGGKGAPAAGSGFGTSLAFGKDKFAVGAPGSLVGGAVAGTVSLFDVIAGNLEDPVTASSNASEDGGEFGASIAIDGQTMVVGAPGSGGDVGNAFVFDTDGANQRFELPPVDIVAGQRFGDAVALLGNSLLVGAPGFIGGSGKGASGSGAALSFNLDDGTSSAIVGAGAGDSGSGVFFNFDFGDGPDDGFGSAVVVGDGLSAFGAPDSSSERGSVAVTIDPDQVFSDGLDGPSFQLATVTTAGVPSACPEGSRHERVLFFDDLESGTSGWTPGGSWERQDERSFSGDFAWRASAGGDAINQILTSPIVAELPNSVIGGSQRTMVLSFRQRRMLTGSRSGAECSDAGIVERVVNGSSLTLATDVLEDPFDGVVVGPGNPLAGEEAWCTNRQWTRAAVRLERGTDGIVLPVFTTRSVNFRLATDNQSTGGEWYIDDVHVEYCLNEG